MLGFTGTGSSSIQLQGRTGRIHDWNRPSSRLRRNQRQWIWAGWQFAMVVECCCLHTGSRWKVQYWGQMRFTLRSAHLGTGGWWSVMVSDMGLDSLVWWRLHGFSHWVSGSLGFGRTSAWDTALRLPSQWEHLTHFDRYAQAFSFVKCWELC